MVVVLDRHTRNPTTLNRLDEISALTGTVVGWSWSTTVVQSATVTASRSDMRREDDTTRLSLDETFARKDQSALVGTYVVTGTDPDGKPYAGLSILDVSLAPSGALALNWDSDKIVGVGQVNDHLLSVALSVKGRNVVLVMTINGDGSLSGTWLRCADRGSRGTETWKRQARTRA
jgi:hypothetical protein